MDLTETIFEVLDMRSFSNLWYWIVLAVTWSSASYFIIGVPYSMLVRARRHGGQAQEDLETMVRLRLDRISAVTGLAGLSMFASISFVLSSLAVIGFVYKIEFCQAVFLLAFPLSFVGLLTLSTGLKIKTAGLRGEDLRKALMLHRFFVQLIGMASVFVTVFWGIYQNLNLGALG